jgi:ribonucleoside-diphosphate reductase alpha chain
MKVERVYTKPGVPVEAQLEWKRVDVLVKDGKTGKTIFAQSDVEVPVHWSDNAAQILASKYFRKAGIPLHTIPCSELEIPDWLRRSTASYTEFGFETSAKQVFHRLAGCWTYWGWKHNYFNGEDALVFYDECYMMLAMQVAAPNSPQWFNTGLHWAYGIAGPDSGQWAMHEGDETSGEKPYPFLTLNSYERPQPHACFLTPVTDDLVNEGGIMDLWVREARIFKHGSGSGVNVSDLRSKGEKLSGGGAASGVMSWLEIGDRAAGAIQSGGTTRRAAKMVILDMDHPEIEEFIDWKVREESKAAAMYVGSQLMRNYYMGIGDARKDPYIAVPSATIDRFHHEIEPELFGIGWEEEAIRSVSGQNSNNSVRITDEFMKMIDGEPEEPESWDLISRTTNEVVKSLEPGVLWHKICRAAWASADPGVLFHDTINYWNTCPNDGEIRTTNPCSEFHFLDGNACNLASLRLTAFLQDDGEFDVNRFCHAARIWTMVLDISVTMAAFPTKEFAQAANDYRTLGLGYADLGGLLMRMTYPYDSEEGRNTAAAVTALMHFQAYKTSNEMAEALAPFPRWEVNKQPMEDVIALHYNQIRGITSNHIWLKVVELNESIDLERGFRNAQVTLLAPTGTISFVMDCDTTGIEPDYSLVKHKSLAGGGSMDIVNQGIEPTLYRLSYSPNEVNSIVEHVTRTGGLQDCDLLRKEHLPIFACANEIDPMGHVKMVAAVQPYLSGAVSKTINLPKEATVEDVSEVYLGAWRMGLKSVALYRDGSKLTQPLSSVQKPTKTWNSTTRTLPTREMLPWRRSRSYTQKVKIDGQSVYLHVGEYNDGRPGEIFLELAHQGSTLRAMGNLFAIAVSVGLQHGIPVEQYIKNFLHTKFEPAGIVEGHNHIKMVSSIADYIARELAITYCGRYDLANIKPDEAINIMGAAEVIASQMKELSQKIGAIGFDLTSHSHQITGNFCPQCHNAALVKAGTCEYCRECSYNTGCA